MHSQKPTRSSLNRRAMLGSALASVGAFVLSRAAAETPVNQDRQAPVRAKDPLKITKLETFLVKPR
jgi:hypothetical protein